MCGIDVVIRLRNRDIKRFPDCFILSSNEKLAESACERRASFVSRRGPDSSQSFKVECDIFSLDMFSSVLHIQGSEICGQPVVSDTTGSVLCWNGEFLNHPATLLSDTCLVSSMLELTPNIPSVLNKVEGPFAFVYYCAVTRCVWFGKDKYGRRSLQISICEDTVVLSSCLGTSCEISPTGLFKLDLVDSCISFHEWETCAEFSNPDFLLGVFPSCIDELAKSFEESISRHMLSQSTVCNSSLGILFSGGLDSMIIATIAADLFGRIAHSFTHIDLINVAANCDSPDRLTGLVSYWELLTKFPNLDIRLILVDICETEMLANESRIVRLIAPHASHMDFNIACALWFGSRGSGRVLNAIFFSSFEWPNLCAQICASQSVEAALADKTSTVEQAVIGGGPCRVCEVRKSPKIGCFLCKFCCLKVGNSTCSIHHKLRVSKEQDISPLLDNLPTLGTCTSTCRVLLVGHGADELFGGYGRHETRAKRGGLREEMILDLSRLWDRNLGRDDRIMADHGRDVRHPFLDEAVVRWVAGNRVTTQQNANKPILREMAKHLGLKFAPTFRKRAIQFGTRLAQKTNIAKFGSHSKGSGKAEYVTYTSEASV